MNANTFALTFAFALKRTSPTSKSKRECKQPHTTVQTFVQTPTDSALNVNRSYKVSANLKLYRFGQTAAHAGNIKIKRNNFFEEFVGYWKCVLLMKCLQVQKMRTTLRCKLSFYLFAFFAGSVSLRISQKNYFVNPFFVMGKYKK
jgi:hypothetical protein